MAVSEGTVIGDVVKFEEDQMYSRKTCSVGTSQTLVIGTICETSGGNKIIVGTAANADSICLEAVVTTGSVGEALFLVRHAQVVDTNLDYNGETAATVNAALEALGIVVQDGLTYSSQS
jgi:phosphoheptose isomerase